MDSQSGARELYLAIANRDASALAKALARGADPMAEAPNGELPLARAVDFGWLEGARLLIRRGADIEASGWNESALHRACALGRLDCVELLTSLGANLDSLNGSGRSPAWLAALWGHVDCLRFLLDRGAKIDASDSRGCSLAMAAAQKARLDCLALLIERGADLAALDAGGRNARALTPSGPDGQACAQLIDAAIQAGDLDREALPGTRSPSFSRL